MIGIRREDKNIWEHRVPLTPEHVAVLKKEFDIETVLQPFPRRAYSDKEYQRAGAHIDEDLSSCPVVLAVKELPLAFIQPDKVYIFFSHTIKGQSYNMKMLQRLLDFGCTVIDYECIKDENGKRLVFFGRFAGLAGMIDALYALGRRLAVFGLKTPLLDMKPAYLYRDLEDAKKHVEKIGAKIRKKGLPEKIRPFATGFAGYGQVSRGAQEIFDLLPHESVDPDDLDHLDPHYGGFFKTVFKEEHMVKPIENSYDFSLRDYYVHPEKYTANFEKYLQHLQVLVNGIYWDERYPRLVTKHYLQKHFAPGLDQQLQLIADISCDINGSIECTEKATPPDVPTYVYNPVTNQIADGVEGQGVVVLAVDNLPAELARDSSAAFSDSLWHFIPDIVNADLDVPFDQVSLPEPIKSATIAFKGKLTPDFRYLQHYL